MFGFYKKDEDWEDDIFLDQKKKMKALYITFGVIAFIIFNLIMYFLIAF